MSELLGWETTSLGKVAFFEMGQAPPGSASNFEGSGTVFVKAGEFGNTYPIVREWTTDPKKFAKFGDVLICVVGATAGKLNLGIDCAIGRSVAAIRPASGILQGTVYYQLLRIVQELRKGTTGSAQGVISKDVLSNIEISLPPLNEQMRIADKLDALLKRVDACREKLDRVPLILKRFRQAVLAAATSGALTENWREVNLEKVSALSVSKTLKAAHDAAGGHKVGNAATPTEDVHDLTRDMFPGGWELHTLRDLVRPDRPITYGILKPGPELENGVPYLRVADFPNDRLNLSSIRKTSFSINEEFKRSRLSTGDILLSIRGTVGRLVVIPSELEGANITQDSARLSLQPQLNCDYILWFLRSKLAQERMKRAEKGVAVRGINIGDVRALQVAIPSRQEQDEIARRIKTLFDFADRLEARYLTARKQVDHLPPSLLAKAFRGELVEQDPNDEPASALLERIKAERVKTVTTRSPVPARSTRSTRLSKQATPPPTQEPAKEFGTTIPQRLLAAMQAGRDYGRAEITAASGISDIEWSWAIKQLKEEGKVRQTGERRGARYRRV